MIGRSLVDEESANMAHFVLMTRLTLGEIATVCPTVWADLGPVSTCFCPIFRLAFGQQTAKFCPDSGRHMFTFSGVLVYVPLDLSMHRVVAGSCTDRRVGPSSARARGTQYAESKISAPCDVTICQRAVIARLALDWLLQMTSQALAKPHLSSAPENNPPAYRGRDNRTWFFRQG